MKPRTFCMVAIAFFATNFLLAENSNAIQIQQFKDVIPEDCVLYGEWAAGPEFYHSNQTPTEKWMKQPEIAGFYKKIRNEIKTVIEKFEKDANDRFFNTAQAKVGRLILESTLDKPGRYMVCATPYKKNLKGWERRYQFNLEEDDEGHFDPEEDKDDNDPAYNVIDLRPAFFVEQQISPETEKAIKTICENWKKTLPKEGNVREKTIRKMLGIEFYALDLPYRFSKDFKRAEIQFEGEDEVDEEEKKDLSEEEIKALETNAFYGVSGGYVYSLSPSLLEKMKKQKGKPSPKWYKNLKGNLKEKRTQFLGYCNFRPFVKSAASYPKAKPMVDCFGWKCLKDATLTVGLSERGTVSRFQLNTNKPTGVLGMLGTKKALTPADFDGFKPTTHHVFKAKVDWSNLGSIVALGAGKSTKEDQADFLDQIEGMAGFDVLAVGKSLGNDFTVSGSITAPIPYSSWTFKNSIKDSDEFTGAYDNYFTQLENMIEEAGGMLQIQEDTIRGQDVKTTSLFILPAISSTHSEKELSIGFNKRTVGKSVLPPKKKVSSKFGTTDPMSILWDMKKNQCQGDLIAGGRFDFLPAIKTGLPLLKGFLKDQPLIFGTKLSFKDIPKTSVLTKGLKPIVGGIYRNDQGFQIYLEQTIPQAIPPYAGYIGMAMETASRLSYASHRKDNEYRDDLIEYNEWEFRRGLSDYQEEIGGFPAAYSVDENGKPLLSWRVHLLPHMGESDLYDQFHLDEPWDSPHNKKLLEKIPSVYRCDDEGYKTTVQAIVGKDTVFRKPLDKVFDMTAGWDLVDFEKLNKSIAIIVQTKKEHAVPWTAPQDFMIDEKESESKLELRQSSLSVINLQGRHEKFRTKKRFEMLQGKSKITFTENDEDKEEDDKEGKVELEKKWEE